MDSTYIASPSNTGDPYANQTTWANGFIKQAGDWEKYGTGGFEFPTQADGRIDTASPAFTNFMATASETDKSKAIDQWNFRSQQVDRFGNPNTPGNAGVGSFSNNLSWMAKNNPAGSGVISDQSKDPLTTWLSAGSSPTTAQQQPATSSPNSWGGGSTAPSQNLGMGGAPSNGASGSSGYGTMPSAQINPYLDQMAGSITNQVTDNYNRNIAPSVRSGAMAAGGFGGSRQGVVEANGMRDLNQTLGNSLANLYGTGWQNAQQNALQNKSLDNSFNLGMSNLDSNNAQFGANLNLNTLNAQNQWANNSTNAANQMAQLPMQYQQMFQNQQNQIAGQGGQNTNSQNMPGNPYLGALGGFQLANKYFGG